MRSSAARFSAPLAALALLAMFESSAAQAGEPANRCPQVLLEVGGTGSDPGEFDGPVSVAADPAGNIYVADNGNDRVQVFSAGGAFLLSLGNEGSAPGQFSGPASLAVSPSSSRVYVSEYGTDRVQVFELPGPLPVFVIGGPGSGPGEFQNPSTVVLSLFDRTHVADTNNGRVQRFTPGGDFGSMFGSPGQGEGQFRFPRGLAVSPTGRIFVSDSVRGVVLVFDQNGSFLFEFGGLGTGDGQFTQPSRMALDGDGNLYVVDRITARIQVFDQDGNFRFKFGLFGSAPGQFNLPEDVFVDGSGKVYVADTGNDRIEVMTLHEPLEVTGLIAAASPSGVTVLSWSATAADDAYMVTRADLSELSATNYGGCLAVGLTETSFVDTEVPAPNQGFAYLVQTVSPTCGLGPLGFDSSGSLRVNENPGACAGP